MKTHRPPWQILLALLLGISGCASGGGMESGMTNQDQPGPKAGRAMGTAAGAVAGNVAGAAAAAGEGASNAAAKSFTPAERRTIRKWETVTTEDGREIQVSKEYLVDEQGNIIKEVKR